MGFQRRSVLPVWARLLQAMAVAVALGGAMAHAESLKFTTKQPVALFVDVAEQQIPEAGQFRGRKFDLNGLPVLLGSGPSNEIGVRTGTTVDFGDGFSLEGRAALWRSAAAGVLLPSRDGMSEAMTGFTARLRQGGWDVAFSPEISTAYLDASRLPNYVLGGSVTRHGKGGWAIEATSRYELRRSDTPEASAGAMAAGRLGFAHLPLFGARLDLGYAYDWSRPASETATLSHGPSAALNLELSDALQCRVAYRYEFAGDLRGVDPGFAWVDDGGQDFSVGWDWDLAAEGFRGTTLRADFSYHQDFYAAAAPAESSGGINVAMTF